MKHYIFINNKIYISRDYLSRSIDKNTLKVWKFRRSAIFETFNSIEYIIYDSIPKPSLKSLPSKEDLVKMIKDQDHQKEIDFLIHNMSRAIIDYESYFLNELNSRFGNVLAGAYKRQVAKMSSIFKYLFNVRFKDGNNTNTRRCFNELVGLPNKDKDYSIPNIERERLTATQNQVFSKYKQKIQKLDMDFLEALVDKKRLGSHKKGVTKFDKTVLERITYFLSDDRKFTPNEVYRLVGLELKTNGQDKEIPCPRSIYNLLKILMKEHSFREKRLGESKAASFLPKQLMEKVTNTGMIWQIDGWVLPFWVNGDKKFERWVLVRVIDTCSGKILGFTIGKNENTELIMGALNEAITNTKIIPLQLVMDKHSASKTHDYKHFKAIAEKLGCTVINSHKATDKPEIERHNQYINSILKEYDEWLGEGINGKTSIRRPEEVYQELAKTKNHISPEEVINRGALACERFNTENSSLNHGLTPNEVYNDTENKGIKIDYETQLLLLTDPKSYKVKSGQILITRGTLKAQYTLPVAYSQQYDNEKVKVHYERFGGGIYIYDHDDNFIVYVEPDKGVSKLKSIRDEQNHAPKQLGIKKGITNHSEKYGSLNESLDSLTMMPSHLIHKDAHAEMEQHAQLKKFASIEGRKIVKSRSQSYYPAGEQPKGVFDPELEDNSVAILTTFGEKVKGTSIKKE